jgi:hypothetical protein
MEKVDKSLCLNSHIPVLVNGSPTDEFPLERGLQQGDPLSPFLFLLAAEGMNMLTQSMFDSNIFMGYSISLQDIFLFLAFSSQMIRYF